jgi:hypothetical protein
MWATSTRTPTPAPAASAGCPLTGCTLLKYRAAWRAAVVAGGSAISLNSRAGGATPPAELPFTARAQLEPCRVQEPSAHAARHQPQSIHLGAGHTRVLKTAGDAHFCMHDRASGSADGVFVSTLNHSPAMDALGPL